MLILSDHGEPETMLTFHDGKYPNNTAVSIQAAVGGDSVRIGATEPVLDSNGKFMHVRTSFVRVPLSHLKAILPYLQRVADGRPIEETNSDGVVYYLLNMAGGTLMDRIIESLITGYVVNDAPKYSTNFELIAGAFVDMGLNFKLVRANGKYTVEFSTHRKTYNAGSDRKAEAFGAPVAMCRAYLIFALDSDQNHVLTIANEILKGGK